jgi:hypothetical protein
VPIGTIAGGYEVRMEQILPGVVHWSAIHPNTGVPAHSAFLLDGGTLIDPIAPEEGLGWFEGHRPERALLTNRHHLRSAEAFGCPLYSHPAGFHELEKRGLDVRPMVPGDRPAPGVTVLEIGAITPEEVALHIDAGPGVVALADCVLRGRGGALAFMPDSLLGDDPEEVKRGLRAALGRIVAEQEFDALLLAHGEPRASGGKAELEAFLSGA